MKTSMREMVKNRNGGKSPAKTCPVCGKSFTSIFKTCSRKCGYSLTRSPYEERGKARAWADDKQVEPALVVRDADLAAFDRMCANRPLRPPPTRFVERNDAARVAARKDRNGVA